MAMYVSSMKTSLRHLFVVGWLVLSQLWAPVGGIADEPFPADNEAILEIAGGRLLQGSLVDCDDPSILRWSVPGFERPFDMDVKRVEGIRFVGPRDSIDMASDTLLRLTSGDVIHGNLIALNASKLRLETPHGSLELPRAVVRSLTMQRSSPPSIDRELTPLEKWVALQDTWRETPKGLTSAVDHAALFWNLHIPRQACIELRISWPDSPDFAFVIGAGPIADRAKRDLRMESWGSEVVLVRESADKAELLVVRKLKSIERKLCIFVYLDQESGHAIVVSESQEVLGELTLPGTSGPGLHVEAGRAGFTLEHVGVTAWNGLPLNSPDGGQPRLRLVDGTAIHGKLQEYDHKSKEFLVEKDQQTTRMSATQIDEAILNDQEASADAERSSVVSLVNGTRLLGRTAGVSEGALRFRIPDAEATLRLPLKHIVNLTQDGSFDDDDPTHSPTIGVLELKGQRVVGKLEGIVAPHGSPQLVWHPIGSRSSSPLSPAASGKIVFRAPQQPVSPQLQIRQMQLRQRQLQERQWRRPGGVEGLLGRVAETIERIAPKPPSDTPHVIHLRDGDIIPCLVESIDEEGVHFTSRLPKVKFVPHAEVQAVVLAKDVPQNVPPKRKRQRLLTLPRMQRDSPPTHLIQSRQGDFLRTRVLGMDKGEVKTEIHLATKSIPRAQVAFITWLHEGEGENSRVTPAIQDQVQGVQGDGIRVTFVPTNITGTMLSGTNPVLGDVQVDLNALDELLIGDMVQREASRLSFHRWKLHPAIEPRYVTEQPADDAPANGRDSEMVGTVAPRIEEPMLDGTAFDLKSHQGKILILDFWATWCGPCVQWLPELERIVAEFADQGVELVAVNLEEDAATIRKLLDRLDTHPPVLLDRDGVVAHAYQARSIPQTVIIDRDGTIARVFIGGGNTMSRNLRAALREMTGPGSGNDRN